MKHRKLLTLGVDATAPVAPMPNPGPRANPTRLRGWVANPSRPRPTSQAPVGLSGWIA